MLLTDERRRFGALSARLTGFTETELTATGLTEAHRALAAERLGPDLYARLLHEARDPDEAVRHAVDDVVDDELAHAARAVTYLWYTGGWPGGPPAPAESRASAEALVWKAAGLAAPGTAPGGYGSWADESGPSAGVSGGRR
ncbi:hypothetical protein ACFVU3_05005 [Streptomyces sp. NPDC058052]|uniref:hypothetical protein n=1 Tax=Streptomyces sp. NPDC058052 TaxID=3346316 RepID=UPI0036EC5339